MKYFPVQYDSRVVISEHKMFIRLATAVVNLVKNLRSQITTLGRIALLEKCCQCHSTVVNYDRFPCCSLGLESRTHFLFSVFQNSLDAPFADSLVKNKTTKNVEVGRNLKRNRNMTNKR